MYETRLEEERETGGGCGKNGDRKSSKKIEIRKVNFSHSDAMSSATKEVELLSVLRPATK